MYRLHLRTVWSSQNPATHNFWADDVQGQQYWSCRQGKNVMRYVSVICLGGFILRRMVRFPVSITDELRKWCEFLGFRSGATISVLLGCSTTSLGDWCPTFRDTLLAKFLRNEKFGNVDLIILQKLKVSDLSKGYLINYLYDKGAVMKPDLT
jgi:hypothetical protein